MSEPSLTEFLLARIAEDEANIDGDWAGGDGGLHIISSPMHDRMVAECAAKRRIVELAEDATGLDMSNDHEFHVESVDGPRTEPYCGDLILRALARLYADHPDYRPEWRP